MVDVIEVMEAAEEVAARWVTCVEADEVVAALEVQPNGMSIATSSPTESIGTATRDLDRTLPSQASAVDWSVLT